MSPHTTNVATLSYRGLRVTDLPTNFTYATARSAGLTDRALRELVADGAVERIGLGAYRHTDAAPIDVDLVALALRVEHATLCLTSALAHHELTDAIPAVLDVALPRERRPPRLDVQVRWHRFQSSTFALGRETMQVDEGLSLGVYGADRSVVDAFRLRHLVGQEVAVGALRRWLRRPGANPARLLALARSFPKGEPALRAALQVLL
jgi:predicted transcriptional regulator of viral defense system